MTDMIDKTDVMRGEFEAWAVPQGFRMHVRDVKGAIRFGQYCDDTTQAAWEAYQAALQSPVVRELIEADHAFDKAKDDIAAAKKAKGSWSVNPLGHNHPAVIAMREAVSRRAAALANFAFIKGDKP